MPAYDTRSTPPKQSSLRGELHLFAISLHLLQIRINSVSRKVINIQNLELFQGKVVCPLCNDGGGGFIYKAGFGISLRLKNHHCYYRSNINLYLE